MNIYYIRSFRLYILLIVLNPCYFVTINLSSKLFDHYFILLSIFFSLLYTRTIWLILRAVWPLLYINGFLPLLCPFGCSKFNVILLAFWLMFYPIGYMIYPNSCLHLALSCWCLALFYLINCFYHIIFIVWLTICTMSSLSHVLSYSLYGLCSITLNIIINVCCLPHAV